MKSLCRVSNHCDLSGLGGEKADGRWHTAVRGKRIVYLSEHPALALIENMANLKGSSALFPEKYRLLEVHVEDDVLSSTGHIVADDGVSHRLNNPLSWTQDEGDSWLKAGKDASRVRLGACHWLEYDKRFFKIRS